MKPTLEKLLDETVRVIGLPQGSDNQRQIELFSNGFLSVTSKPGYSPSSESRGQDAIHQENVVRKLQTYCNFDTSLIVGMFDGNSYIDKLYCYCVREGPHHQFKLQHNHGHNEYNLVTIKHDYITYRWCTSEFHKNDRDPEYGPTIIIYNTADNTVDNIRFFF